MKKLLNILVLLTILTLLSANFYLVGWHGGFAVGYGDAMANLLIGLDDPYHYFMQFVHRPPKGK